MKTEIVDKKTLLFGLAKAFLITIPMWLVTFVLITRFSFPDPYITFSKISVYLFFNIMFFMAIYTKKIDRYRAIIFILTSIGFSISFILNLYSLRGNFMVLKEEEIASCLVPFCHIVIPQTLVTLLYKKEVIFPGTFSGFQYTISSMIILWIGGTLALGRGWCAWFCFFGGWEDGCSRLRKKTVVHTIPKKLLFLPFAILFAVVLICNATLSPQYCWWLCPFKAVTEFVEPSNFIRIIQITIFVILFLSLVIIFPILTKKRIQCSVLCPFGAMQSFTNKINPFEIKIDSNKCVKCKRCIRECPVFALDEESIEKGCTRITCIKCGKCIDNCAAGAINYHIKGTKFNVNSRIANMLFLYIAFIMLSAAASNFLCDAVYRILIIISTGNFRM